MLTSDELEVLELVRTQARMGVETVAVHLAPILDKLQGLPPGDGYRPPVVSPFDASIHDRLVDLHARNHFKLANGDNVTPGIRQRLASVGQPMPQVDEFNVVKGPPLPGAQQEAQQEAPAPAGLDAAQVAAIVADTIGRMGLVPQEAQQEALAGPDHSPPVIPVIPVAEPPPIPLIGDIDLRRPAREAMIEAGITKLSDLKNYTERQFCKIHGCGPGIVKELSESMQLYNVRWQNDSAKRSGRES